MDEAKLTGLQVRSNHDGPWKEYEFQALPKLARDWMVQYWVSLGIWAK